MARYEFAEGSSNKFWEIKLAGKSFTTTYGKIGTDGQTSVKTFKSDEEARKEHDKIVAEKTKKGYALVGGGGDAKKAPAPEPDDDDDEPVVKKVATTVAPATKPAAVASSASGTPGARYFEFVEGTSSKFWEIALEDTSVKTRYGKIGTEGQQTLKDFDDRASAFKELDKLITEKTKKGYTEKVAEGAGGADKRNLDLEKAILADPNDKDAYSVYADWLQGEGDPRGELIALQIAGKDKAAQALIDKQADYFLGPLADHVLCHDGDLGNNGRSNTKQWEDEHRQAFLWKFGFIHRLRLAHDAYADEEFEGSLAEVLEMVLRHPSGRFISELSFMSNGDPNEDDLQDLIDILAKKAPATIRKIVIGDNVDQISWYNVGNLSKLWKAIPGLRSLEIEAGSFTLGTIDLPNLTHAVFKTGGLSQASGKSIASASWPKIETLDIYYGDDNYGGDCTVEDVQPLLDRTDLKSLKTLGLRNSMFADELCKVLGHAKIVKQLSKLDLSLGCMGDEGVAALVELKDAFKHLDVLDLSHNYLSPAGVKAAKVLAKKVETGDQRDDDGDPEDRSPSVSE
ncbi:MAG: hypothetical protein JWO36_6952 [Myxococcales bacterium]|nr:hypothetical protein [Myxococcales bacterium]